MGRSAFVEVPSYSLLIEVNEALSARGDLCRDCVESLLRELDIRPEELQITIGMGWRRFTPKLLEKYLEDEATKSIVVMVGQPLKVHLTAGWYLRPH